MARGPCTFRQQVMKRALRATVAAGIEVRRIEIDTDGKIVVVTGKPETQDFGPLDKWMTAHAHET